MLKITEIEHVFLTLFRAVCFLERLHGQKQIDDRAGRGGDFFREFLVFRVACKLLQFADFLFYNIAHGLDAIGTRVFSSERTELIERDGQAGKAAGFRIFHCLQLCRKLIDIRAECRAVRFFKVRVFCRKAVCTVGKLDCEVIDLHDMLPDDLAPGCFDRGLRDIRHGFLNVPHPFVRKRMAARVFVHFEDCGGKAGVVFVAAEHIRQVCPKVFVFVPLGQCFVERFGHQLFLLLIGDDGKIGRDTEQVEKFAHNVRTEAVHRADVRLLQ